MVKNYAIIKYMTRSIKPKLLVVDDEPDQYTTIRNYFSRRNFRVFTADSGCKALKSIKENNPDLVLLDIMLAGAMDGRGVLRALQKHDKKVKVVVITGNLLSEEQIQQITDLGAVELLCKPLDFKALEEVIRKILQKKYPKATLSKQIATKSGISKVSLGHRAHELTNTISDMANKCELYILDSEEGINKDKSEKERLDEAIKIIKFVLKSTDKITDSLKKIVSSARK